MKYALIASATALTLAGAVLGAGTIANNEGFLLQIDAAGPNGKPLDDNTVAGTTTLWTSSPYGFFEAGTAFVRNTWSWRSTTAGGVAQSLTGSATIDSQSYVGNVATIKFSNAGTSASGLFKGTLVMTLNQGATETTLNQKLTLELTTPPVGPTPGFAIYNMIDNKLKGGHNNDVLNTTAIVSGNRTGIRADDGEIYSIHSAVNPTKYQGGTTGSLMAAGVFTGGDLSNAIVDNADDTATAFEWKTALSVGQPVSFESSFVVRNYVPAPASAGVLGLGLLAAGRRRR